MNGSGKSDDLVVPRKSPNKGRGTPGSAEAMEGRGSAEGNTGQGHKCRTQSRGSLQTQLGRVREAARRDKSAQLNSLWHHVCNVDRLRAAYRGVNRRGAAGVDGTTWEEYGEELETNLEDLSGRLARGSYRAKPVRRVYIPKGDGRQRPLGVPALEDKIVQRATVEVLNAVFEGDFKSFSYGFRPGRSQHDALDAVTVGIERRRVRWVFDADIRGFFDAIDHEWLLRFVEHRIADRRVLRHIKKWLNAGVLEDGEIQRAKEGTPQGGSISPLLANLYLHHVLDLWVDHWRKHHARGHVIIVRYADDFVMGFEYRADAERFRTELEERLQRFNLELHPDKTRLIPFGRKLEDDDSDDGDGTPGVFNFLGFTHYCGKTRRGRFTVKRKTEGKRARKKLKALYEKLRRRMHRPIAETGAWLAQVLRGHYQYYGVPWNTPSMWSFRDEVERLWRKTLRRRSHKDHTTWDRQRRLTASWLPAPRIMHPYPSQRLAV